MLDRLLSQGITLVILGLISAGCGGGLYLLFMAWNECLTANWSPAFIHGLGAFGSLLAMGWICKHREELSDSW